MLRQYGKLYEEAIPQNESLFHTLWPAIQAPLATNDERTLEIIRLRIANTPEFLDEFLNVDEVTEVFDELEMEDLEAEEEEEKKKQHTARQFIKDYKSKRASVMGGYPEKGSPEHPLTGIMFPGDFPPEGDSEINQTDAARLLPPGASIWKGNARARRKGSWNCHYPPYPRASKTWIAAGSERLACLWCVQHCWRLYLADHRLPLDHVPITVSFDSLIHIMSLREFC